MDIGNRLKIARKSIGYTQAEAAKKSGVGESSISEFEKSKRKPSFSQLSQLAEIYQKTIGFFFEEANPAPSMMLWRDEPENDAQRKKTEADFLQLCQQYRRLELCTSEIKNARLPQPDKTKVEEFDFRQAEFFARKVQESFKLGEVPIASLKQILEEVYYIKIFYLSGFSGSSISVVSEDFGPAILLNCDNKQWRRSYDLAHELFHILTWEIFRTQDNKVTVANKDEEKLANAFASRLLMPNEPLEQKIRTSIDGQGQISFDKLDDIAREYDVSLDALIVRMASIFKIKKEEIQKYRDAAKKYMKYMKPRPSYRPDRLPERYCALAVRALREGNLSLIQFAKYMGISYKKAQAYLTEDGGFTDETISISVA